MVKISVVGAGVIGVSTAYCIQERNPHAEITIFGEKLSPNTTGDGAAGLWCPYLCGGNSPENIIKWAGKTYDHLFHLWNSPEAGEMGISLIPVYKVTNERTPIPEPEWKDAVFGLRKMSPAELRLLNKPDLRHGLTFTSFTCECSKYLPALLKKFQERGGRSVQKHVNNLQHLRTEFDIVVNCTGLGARALVNDNSVHPIRGQIIRVKAPELKHIILDESEDGGYVIPNQDRVILGGTKQENDWNLTADDKDRNFIEGCCFSMIPALKTAEVIDDFVGLRPARPTVRIEMEVMEVGGGRAGGNGKPFIVVHNYGHGGSGITLAWGCALDACDLVEKAMQQLGNEIRSKL